MEWKRIKQEQDPDWIEWHKKAITKDFGEVNLKVWRDSNGSFRAVAVTRHTLVRHVIDSDSGSIVKAKETAKRWARLN